MRRLVPLVVVVLLLAAGCSTSKPGEKTARPLPNGPVSGVSTQPTTTTASVPAKYQDGDTAAGKSIFKTGPCAGCHTLADAGTSGTVGPNLDQAKPPLSLVVDRLLNGKGAMPSFKGQLSDKQIADVAAYVVSATGGGTSG